MRCPNCRAENPEGLAVCTHCGAALTNLFAPPEAAFVDQPAAPRPSTGEDEAVATIIPYKNASALTAYYLGLFSCFPLLGFPMACVALWLGVKGLKAVKADPRIHGTAHAWVGLVCGTIGLLINGLMIVGVGIAAFAAATGGPR